MILYPNPNPGHPPSGGTWQYRCDGVGLSHDTFDQLVDLVCSHLSTKLYTRGEIEQMVLAQEKIRCPWMVREKDGDVSMPTKQVEFREYVKGLGTSEYLDQDDADNRAAICLKCPYNVPCDIDPEASRLLFLLARGKAPIGMGWCSVHRHHNAIACQLARKTLPKPEQPPECWVIENKSQLALDS